MPKITVHHLERSRSLRALWLLEELGLDYDIQRYDRDPQTMRAPPELKRVHPLGRAPVITVDDLVLAESGAILEYFADRHEGLRPDPESPEFLKYRFFLHYAEGSAMPPLLVRLIFDKLKEGPVPFFVRPITRMIADKIDEAYTVKEIETHFGFVEAELSERPYFAGDTFTAADIQMIYPVEAALGRGRFEGPNMRAWLARIGERPAYQKALAIGGPVALEA